MQNINNKIKKTFLHTALIDTLNNLRCKTSGDIYCKIQIFFGESESLTLINFRNNVIHAKYKI
jgi:hypothetical protein